MSTNTQTGVAFPGYKALAAGTGYKESTVELTITELLKWGFLASIRKTAEPGGRTRTLYRDQAHDGAASSGHHRTHHGAAQAQCCS
jgi:hypothetical protein